LLVLGGIYRRDVEVFSSSFVNPEGVELSCNNFVLIKSIIQT